MDGCNGFILDGDATDIAYINNELVRDNKKMAQWRKAIEMGTVNVQRKKNPRERILRIWRESIISIFPKDSSIALANSRNILTGKQVLE